MERLKQVGSVLKEAAGRWSNDNAVQLAAALSYYAVFSLAPLLFIVVLAAGLAWGGQPADAQAHILNEMREVIGPEGAEMLSTMLDNVTERGAGGGTMAIIGLIGLLFGATGVFAQLQTSLNTIWRVKPDPERGFMNMVTTRLLSFGLILAIGFLLLVSLILSAAISMLETAVLEYLPGTYLMVNLIDYSVSFLVITLLFATIYNFLPDVKIAWKDVWIGAILTAALFIVGKFGLSIYIGNTDMTQMFGAAGSLVVLLLWIYYSSLIFFYGAEVTQVYANRYGSDIEPSSSAVPMDREDAAAAGITTDEDQDEEEDGNRDQHSHEDVPHKREPARTPLWKKVTALGAAFLLGRWLTRR